MHRPTTLVLAVTIGAVVAANGGAAGQGSGAADLVTRAAEALGGLKRTVDR